MHETLAVIDLKGIRKNAAILSAAAARPLIAVVKDDAYGHGAEEVAAALQTQVAAFAVATPAEGAALRIAGISAEILVLTPPLCLGEALRIFAYRLTPTLSSLRSLRLLGEGKGVRAHIAVNTGMNRYGVRPERAGELARRARDCGVEVTGVFSHLYAPADPSALREQAARFERAAEEVRRIFPNAVRHLAASGGLRSDVGFDAVRAGIALYGYCPAGVSLPVRPAMRVYATVAETRTALGGGFGYGTLPAGVKKTHTLRYGYGDGFFRDDGPGEAKLCMDACLRRGEAKAGQRRLILRDAEEYAAKHGTTAYEVLVRIGNGAVRTYLH